MKTGRPKSSTVSQLLLLLADVGESVLDPRIRRFHGDNIPANGIAAILQNIDYWFGASRQDLSRDTLYLVIERDMNPARVYEALCEHGEWYAYDHSTMLIRVLEEEFVPEAVISKLLEHGADPNFRFGEKAPLSITVQSQLPGTIIKLFLEQGADPDLEDGLGTTPRLTAELLGLSYITKLFDIHVPEYVEDIGGAVPDATPDSMPQASIRSWVSMQLALPSLQLRSRSGPS